MANKLPLAKHLIRSVLVTGTNRGIGLELVRHFAKERRAGQDIKIISCSRTISPELEELLEDVYHFELELTRPADVASVAGVASNILEDRGLNVLINSAGILRMGQGVTGCSHEELKEVLDTNLIGVHSMTAAFHPLLKQAAPSAGVFNISAEIASIAGTNIANKTAYRISKAGLNMLTKITAAEFRRDKIMALAIHPGWVQTDLGGPKAPLTPEQCVQDLVECIENCGRKDSGKFVKKGLEEIPY